MNKFIILIFVAASLLSWQGCSDASPSSNEGKLPDVVDFNYHIKPILSDRCFACHGPDEKAREADLRLDIEESAFALLKDSEDKYAIVKGKPQKSELIKRIYTEDREEIMPPPDSKLSLSNYEKELIQQWISQGAEWKRHWSFISPEKSDLPQVKDADWPLTEIDYFILDRIEKEGLRPSNSTSKEKWIRRVSFDLTGLPPSLGELKNFLADDSPESYEKVVDRLLASPHYGERMASYWLDVARYADSHGYQDDRPRTMWPWRDWVVKAFNDNLAYDEFITWQIAGDLLPNASYEQKLATGFNRNHGITQEGGVVNEEYVTEYVADRTQTVSTAFMGLTMECARCHDHKYDPISQKDYYQLFAFFNNIPERGQISYFDEAPVPNMKVQDPMLENEISIVKHTIDSLEKEKGALLQKEAKAFGNWMKEDWPNLELAQLSSLGLVAHFNFDSYEQMASPNALQHGQSARANTGLQGELKEPVPVDGIQENALRFDGENFMDLGDVGDFEHYDPFSLGAWIQVSSKLDKEQTILSRRNGEQKRGGFSMVVAPGGYLRVKLIHNVRAERIEVRSKGKISMGTWSHVFATYDGSGKASGLQLYLNGKEQEVVVEEDLLKGKSITNGNHLLAGNFTHRNVKRNEIGGLVSGAIDEIRVYDRELSPIEIFALAGNNPKADYSNLPVSQKRLWEQAFIFPLFRGQTKTYQLIEEKLYGFRRKDTVVPKVMIMEEMDTARHSHVLNRGQYNSKQERVYPNTPAELPAFPNSFPTNRLGLAQWISQDDHPLTGRVMVNRMWQLIFGKGIVETPEDFGNQGALPTHPALLDWLAVDFVENDWDIKALLKKIVLSATYRQESNIHPDKFQKDPNNHLLARGPNQRLSAEMIRDNSLAVSGLLERKIGGKWVKPYQAPGLWKELANQIGENKYRKGRGEELYRRSLYTYWKRTIPPPTMLTFDAPERVVCTVERSPTSTPLQSLVLLNDETYIEAARTMAELMLENEKGEIEDAISQAFTLLTSRKPQPKELNVLNSLYESEYAQFSQAQGTADEFLAIGSRKYAATISKEKLAALAVVINTMMNLDEAKMKS